MRDDETALAVQDQAPLTLFGTTDPLQVIRVASSVATALAEVVNERKLYAVVNGKKFPTVEAWTLLGSMLGVFPLTEWVHELRNEDGSVRGFEARVRAQTLTGRLVGAGEARCVHGESKTWHQGAQEFALSSMAQTRATSKALRGPLDFVFKLAGFQPTPAEEMVGSERGWGRGDGEIPVTEASLESQRALGVAENILGGSTNIPKPSSEIPVMPSAPATVGPPNGKRRGRPLGSKNQAKVSAVEIAGNQAHSPSVDELRPPQPVFGDEVEIPDHAAREVDLRSQLWNHASRLRKYQYLEQSRPVPPLDGWRKEVDRALAIYVERKFGTDVRLDDVEADGLLEATAEIQGYIAKYETPDEELGQQAPQAGPSVGRKAPQAPAASSDATVVSLHKPIVRNPVTAPRRAQEGPTAIDPQAALARARLLAELRTRTVALLAAKEGLLALTAADEERLRIKADAVMEAAAGNSFQKSGVGALNADQLQLLVDRAKAAAR